MGQYAGLKDEDLALELYCATQDKAGDHTRTDILDEIAHRYGGFVHAQLERRFSEALTQEDRDEVLLASLNELGNSIDKRPLGPVKLRAWWWHIAHNDAIDLIRQGKSAKRGGGHILSLDQPVKDGVRLEVSTRDTTHDNINLEELKTAIEAEIRFYSPLEQDIIRTLIALAESAKEVNSEIDRRLAIKHDTTAPNVKFVRHQVREKLWDALEKQGFRLQPLRRRS